MKRKAVFLFLLLVLILPSFGQTSHRIIWTWGAVTQDTAGTTITIDGYRVYRGTATGQTTQLLTPAPIGLTTYSDTTGTAGTRYYYTVTAVKGAFESAKSNEINAIFLANPAAPAGVTATSE